MVSKELKIYRGYLQHCSNGEENDLLTLAAVKVDGYLSACDAEPLAKIIQEDIEKFGNFLSVRYWIIDKELPADQITERFLRSIFGGGDAEYQMNYSEFTGYLWTDENIKVGGHDLLCELKSYLGSYCHLEIEYSSAPEGVYE